MQLLISLIKIRKIHRDHKICIFLDGDELQRTDTLRAEMAHVATYTLDLIFVSHFYIFEILIA